MGAAPGAEPRVPGHEGRATCRSPTASSTSRPRSRCSSTCPIQAQPSPRWRASPAATCSSRCPREPLWRGLNIARGAYLKDLGNTPGHLNHWSKRGFVALLSPPRRRRRRHARRSRGPCCSSVSERSEQPRSGYGRGARILSVGIATTGVVTFAYFSLAAHALTEVEYKRISLLWAIMFVIASVIYRPIEQLLSRTIAERRARGHDGRPQPAHPAAHPGGVRARLPRRRARAARPAAGRPLRRLGGAVLGARRRRARLRGQLLRARLPRRPSALRALRRARLPASRSRASCSPSPSSSGITPGQSAVALGMAAAPLVSLLVVPGSSRAATRRPTSAAVEETEGGLTLRHGLPLRGGRPRRDARRADPGQRRGPHRRRDLGRRRARRRRVQRAAHRARAAAALPGGPGLAAPPSRRPAGDGAGARSSAARSA